MVLVAFSFCFWWGMVLLKIYASSVFLFSEVSGLVLSSHLL